MAETGQGSFEVVPTRIGGTGGAGRPGRRRRLPIALVIAVAVAIPAIAWIGPRMESRPEVDLSFLRPTPTPVPSATPRALFPASSPGATPLPAVTIAEGEHPTEPFPIDINGLHLVDPTTGELGPEMGLRLDSDAVFTSADGNGWWCVCFHRDQDGIGTETASVEIRRVDGSGRTTAEQPIGEYVSSATPPQSDFYNRFDLELAPDERTGYLVSATRVATDWTIAVEAIDLATGVVSGRVDLGSMSVALPPGPTPPPDAGIYESYLAGPLMRLSPDGRRLLVWAWVDAYSWTDQPAKSTSKAWTIGLDERSGSVVGRGGGPARRGGGRPAAPVRLGRVDGGRRDRRRLLAAVPGRAVARCGDSFVRTGRKCADRVSQGRSMAGSPNQSSISRTGRSTFGSPIPMSSIGSTSIPAGRTAWRSTRSQPPEFPARPARVRAGCNSREQPAWTTLASDMRIYSTPQLIAEPGGSRLFALGIITGDRGYGGPEYASTGVWVFDAREFSLVDRWTAVTAYGSIGLSSDGRWLLAAGQPGADADGNPAQWQSSLTVHDTVDGRPALLLGSLGSDNQILQIPR